MTPQQANVSQQLRDLTQELRRTPKPLAEIIPLLNAAADELDRRAPAPTEPAVDRDAVLEEAARLVEDFQADKGTPTFNDIAHAIRALATPASPAVPAECTDAMYIASTHIRNDIDRADIDAMWRDMLAAAPQLPQASQPTSAEASHYIPKPPPPRPQRPPGPVWSDGEREQYRKDMKRGERCPSCSVIEGGGHFPGCPRGK